MRVIITQTYEAMSIKAAEMIALSLKKKPNLVLGLATGSTPLGLYKELIRRYQAKELDFSKVATFNLDEYVGISPTHTQSYHYFMFENLFNHINIEKKNVHIPDGLAKNIEAFCENYEAEMIKAGGIDIQILGIGANGHIGFNEPASSLSSKTRIKTLTAKTIQDNARFFEKLEDVPKYAITMGIGTIMKAKECILVTNGINKAEVVKKAIEGPITAQVPASILQLHQDVTFIIEKEAASKLEGDYKKI